MNGAQALIRTLVDSEVDVCFMNPGTSEMHFVHELDQVPGMRSVLALFEGVATGAADGYARMAGRPAAVLLHLGPGLGNGLANLHNARRAKTPVVNIVGDHATYHAKYDAPLQSDIASIAAGVSGWIRTATDPEHVARDAADTVAASYGPPGQVATLILPADVCWLPAPGPVGPTPRTAPAVVPAERIEDVAAAVRSGRTAILVGGTAMTEGALRDVARIGAATGARALAETFPARAERGAGLPVVERLAYLAEFAQAQLDGVEHLVLVDAAHPVSFFAYPDKASDLVPEGCSVHVLAAPDEDAPRALADLVAALDAGGAEVPTAPAGRPDRPTGALNAETLALAIGALLPEGAVVADEGNTGGLFVSGFTAGAPRHDWLCLTGGSIGYGLPVATGAAVAVPDRKVLCLEADGSGMYTLQALWTQARLGLDVTTVVLNNGSYAVLNMELDRVGAGAAGEKAREMLDIPGLDYVSLARGMGVPATRATTAEEFTTQLEQALATDGPALVEAMIPATL